MRRLEVINFSNEDKPSLIGDAAIATAGAAGTGAGYFAGKTAQEIGILKKKFGAKDMSSLAKKISKQSTSKYYKAMDEAAKKAMKSKLSWKAKAAVSAPLALSGTLIAKRHMSGD